MLSTYSLAFALGAISVASQREHLAMTALIDPAQIAGPSRRPRARFRGHG
jgi:hypothetical protein